jgi:large subunit ribosomal protein L29
MKAKEIREKSVAELDNLIRENSKTLFGMHMNKATGEVEKTNQYMQLRRDIARAKTILREKQAAK